MTANISHAVAEMCFACQVCDLARRVCRHTLPQSSNTPLEAPQAGRGTLQYIPRTENLSYGQLCGFLCTLPWEQQETNLKGSLQAGEMTRWLKALEAKPENLGLIPKTNMSEAENQLLEVLLSIRCTHTCVCARTHTQYIKYTFKKDCPHLSAICLNMRCY